MAKIPIIIPAFEPDDALKNLISNLVSGEIKDIIIVDDGSGKKYRHIFEELKAAYNIKIITHAVNLGKGRALKSAFNYILNDYSDVIGAVTADSDGQHTPEDISRCIESLVNHPDDLILGCREFKQDGIPWKSRIGNKLTKKVCSLLCGIKVSDTQTGLRGIPWEFMKQLMNISGERFEFEMNMLIACKNKIKITELPIQTVYKSKEDHKTHFRTVSDSISIYKVLGSTFFKYILSSFSAGILDLTLFALFCKVLKSGGVDAYVAIATVLARIISSSCNCLMNYRLVFGSSKTISTMIVRYFALALAVMCASAFIVTLAVNNLHIYSEVVVKAVADTVLFFISYKIQQKKIF